MDWVLILTIIAAVVGVIAGIVQVAQYFQDRKKTAERKDASANTQTSLPSTDAELLPQMEIPAGKMEERSSHSEDRLEETARPQILHNLPNADYGQFIGRETEIAKIHEILRPYPHSQHSMVTIDGIGGIGKSTLALEVAHYYLRKYQQLPFPERFDAIIWISAKQTILTAQGIQQRPQAFRTLEDIYAAIAITLQRQEITKAEPNEQLEIVRNALTRQRTLLIIDNFETVDDEKVITFLRELPAPTKAIVTTRHRIDVAYPIRLRGMDQNEAEQLILQESEKRNCKLSDLDAQRLYKYTGGVPLAIVWTIAQIGSGYSTENVLRRLGDIHDDIARFCFESVIDNIRSKSAFQLLLALSAFETDASREALGFVADLSELDRDDGLVLLEKLSLANKTSDRFNMLPLTKDYSYSLLVKDEEKLKAIRHRQYQYYMDKLGDFSDNAETRRFRELEAQNILSFIDWRISVSDFEDIPFLVRAVSGYLWAVGHWNTCYKYSQIALGVSQQMQARNQGMEASLLFRIGRIDLMRGDHEVSELRLLEALSLYEELNNIARQAHVASYIGILYINQKRYQESENILVEVLRKARQAGDKKAISRIQNVVGQVYLELGKYDLAETAIREAKDLREVFGLSTGLAASYELLGRIKLLQNQPSEAVRYFSKCYEISKEINVQWYSAFAKKWLAEALMKLNDYRGAIPNLTESIEIFRNTGMADNILAEAEGLLIEAQTKIMKEGSQP